MKLFLGLSVIKDNKAFLRGGHRVLKKSSMIITTLLLVMILSACSSTEGKKIEEVITKSSEVSENLESFAVKTESEQTIHLESGENNGLPPGGIPITSTIDAIHQVEPEAFYQTVETMDQVTEQYYTDKGLYMTSPTQDGWVKAPENVLDQIQAMSSNSQTPAEQLQHFEKYVENFHLEKEKDNYILTFQSNVESAQQLVEDAVQETLPADEIPEELLNNLEVNELKYRMVINKDTYYPQTFSMDMDFNIKEENGESMQLQQSLYSEFSRFNEIEEITIPQDILDEAKEIEDMPGLF